MNQVCRIKKPTRRQASAPHQRASYPSNPPHTHCASPQPPLSATNRASTTKRPSTGEPPDYPNYPRAQLPESPTKATKGVYLRTEHGQSLQQGLVG